MQSTKVAGVALVNRGSFIAEMDTQEIMTEHSARTVHVQISNSMLGTRLKPEAGCLTLPVVSYMFHACAAAVAQTEKCNMQAWTERLFMNL